MIWRRKNNRGFTLVETLFSILVMGFIMVSIASVFILMQKGSAQSRGFTDAQQNARISLDYITEKIRQAGANADYVRGQGFLVHGGPYQIAINADIDNGQTISGNGPLGAIDINYTPNTVPAGGASIYSPARSFTTGAETVVLTLDSDADGVVSSSDQGDDVEESGLNQHLYALKEYVYGYDGAGANVVRDASLALIRGPVNYPDGTVPEPLFQYYYDDDENVTTADVLWGDDSPQDGKLSSTEIGSITPVPDSLLALVRKVKVSVIGESDKFDSKFDDNEGFLAVSMSSEAYLRNSPRATAIVLGVVYHDVDGDGVMDQNESGIPDVEVRLVGTTKSTRTDNFGKYYIALGAGSYSIQEVDAYGYTSTTPNLVSVDLNPGQAEQINFGDISASGFGYILGNVFEDENQNSLKDPGEPGIEEVLLSLDTGEEVFSNQNGDYFFTVQLGNYILVETDKEGYGSTTPNSAEVSVVSDGDTVIVDFGDIASPEMGMIRGYVFLDENEDRVRTIGEEGLASVILHLSSGDSTITNADGLYQFTVIPGVYEIWEVDPEGYISTTVNRYADILVVPDTTITRHFGDILDSDIDFVEIVIGDTERALSVSSLDFEEDNKNDPDVILGTPYNGTTGNLLIYQNNWKNAHTALTKLFSATPTYRRSAISDVNTISVTDLSGDNNWDVLTGQQYNIGNNILLWFNQGGGALGNSPDYLYSSSNATYVMDSKIVDYNMDGHWDLIVGLKTSLGIYTGGIQTFAGQGGGVFMVDQLITMAGADVHLGEIWAVDTGDIDGDGDQDLVVGSHVNDYMGYIDVYRNGGNGLGEGVLGHYKWDSRYMSYGAVNDIKVIDMAEDDQNDPDIVTAMSMAPGAGLILLYLNNDGSFGIPDTSESYYGPLVSSSYPNDYFYPHAECISLDAARINRDVFPDLLVGTRSSEYYTGDLFLLKTFGLLPSFGTQLNESSAGEINTIDLADFNKDSKTDIVVGTRTSMTQGKLIIYFYNE
jgi:type II secretory pathway pseudopilin PulG